MEDVIASVASVGLLWALVALIWRIWPLKKRWQALVAGLLSFAVFAVAVNVPRPAHISEAAWRERVETCELAGRSPRGCANDDNAYEKAKPVAAAKRAEITDKEAEKARERAAAEEARREAERCGDRYAAFAAAQHLVEQRLRAPSTADFASMTNSDVSQLACGRWRVRSYVDAQNAFGAKLRTDFVAEVRRRENGNWGAEKIEIATR